MSTSQFGIIMIFTILFQIIKNTSLRNSYRHDNDADTDEMDDICNDAGLDLRYLWNNLNEILTVFRHHLSFRIYF